MNKIVSCVVLFGILLCNVVFAQTDKYLQLPESFPAIYLTDSGECAFNGFEDNVKSIDDIGSILSLDVCKYYNVKGYDTELQKKYFVESSEGASLKQKLVRKKNKLQKSGIYYVFPFSYNEIKEPKYSIEKQCFCVSFYIDGGDLFPRDKYLSLPYITVRMLPNLDQLFWNTGKLGSFSQPRYRTEIHIPMSEAKAIGVERAMKNIEVLFEFKPQTIDEKSIEIKTGWGGPLYAPSNCVVGDLTNIIVVNKLTRKVLYAYNNEKLNQLIANIQPILEEEKRVMQEKLQQQLIEEMREQSRQDSIKRRTKIDDALYLSKMSGLQMSDSLQKEISGKIISYVLESIEGCSLTSAEIEFNDMLEVLESGEVVHQVKYDKLLVNGDSSADDFKARFLESISCMKVPPQRVTVMDTSFVARFYATIPVSCRYTKKQMKLVFKGGELQYKGKDVDFFNQHSHYLQDYIGIMGAGKYDICLSVLDLGNDYMYEVDVLKYKLFSGKSSITMTSEEINKQVESIKMPEFNDGTFNDFTKWTNARLIYPEIAKENGIHGKVKVGFTIDRNGNVCDVKVLAGCDYSLDKEAGRVVSQSPKWKPARLNGKRVPVVLSTWFYFSLR